jgi:DNA-binding PadR family transcriptional regulator
MKLISRIEELILVSIWRLQDQAYGLSILESMTRSTGKTWLTGSVYSSLASLLKQGLVEAHEGDPTPERGGRRKIFYSVTPTGQRALQQLQKMHAVLWTGLPPFEPEEKG